MSKNKINPITKIRCPKCGRSVRLPFIWIIGVESVFACGSCKTRFRTGYKAGAALFALAFVAAVSTSNLLCLALGSRSMMILFYAVLPLWIFYGVLFRRAWLLRKAAKHSRGRQF